MFGENPSDLNAMKWGLYFTSSMIISVVALNLLIAVISNTFGQVMDTIDAIHCKQKANMLLELAVFNDDISEEENLQYLYIFKSTNEDKHVGSNDDEGGIVKAMDVRIKSLVTKIATSKEDFAYKLKV